jgi:2-polyprenyl-3-methyl-5-hydroxy-6-metoxy-1,4-benzoquinol methylase
MNLRQDPGATPRLRLSPNFVQALTLDGRPYVAMETEPYLQYWLSERERSLLSMFAGRRGATVDEAVDRCSGLLGAQRRSGSLHNLSTERRRLQRAAAAMQDAGVLMPMGADTSRYDRSMVEHYLRHRPFPAELAARIAARAGITARTPVLDLAGGPGDLALQLAQTSAQVTLMELSRGFLAAARARARAAGRALRTVHESCNRLLHAEGEYDVVTVAQALHWLDDVAVCRGVCQVLRPGGHFFVVHSAFEVADAHPLAHVLGHRSVLGAKVPRPFGDEVAALHDRVSLLLRALDMPQVERADVRQRGVADGAGAGRQRLGPAAVEIYRQVRPMGLGFARALLTDRHLRSAGLEPEPFWADAQARCRAATASSLQGVHHWALLHYQRGAKGPAPVMPGTAEPLACTAPAE